MIQRTPLLFAFMCILLSQCIGEEVADGPSGYTQVLESIATQVTLGQYEDFLERSEDMAAAAVSFCASPGGNSLSVVRDAWWDAREPWKKAEIVRFGPTERGPWLRPKLDFWPVNGQVVEEALKENEDFSQETFNLTGGSGRGLPVVEYLLWSTGDYGTTLEALSSDESRRCDMLMGATADVAYNATVLRDTWRDDWITIASDPASTDTEFYASPQDVVDEWVNRMAFTVENIRVMKLGKPAGDKAEGKVQLDILESRLSGRSLADARDALQGVREVWEGAAATPSDEDGAVSNYGIRTLVRNPAISSLIDERMAEAELELGAIEETLEVQLTTAPEVIMPAQEALLELQKVIQSDLADSMNTTIKFNDADGD